VKKVVNADTLKNLIATEYFREYEGEVAWLLISQPVLKTWLMG
jgi:hypothetical protein